jgi:hypothetical protein
MSTRCPQEEAVAAAVRSGRWSPELRAHRDGCLSCAELTLVVAALAADADELVADSRPLPDPGLIWFRAQLASREHKLDRATRGIVWVQRAAVAAVVAVAAALAPEIWSFVGGVVSGLDIEGPAQGLPRAAGSPLLVMVASLLVLGWLALSELTSVHHG